MARELLPYATGALLSTPLVDGADSPPGIVFESGATLASGDFKVVTDAVPIANLSAESIAFTSGSEGTPKGVVLPELLSRDDVLDAFKRASKPVRTSGKKTLKPKS